MLITGNQNKKQTVIGGLLLTLVLLAVCIVGPGFIAHLLHQGGITAVRFFWSRISFWVLVGILYLYSKKVEQQPLLLWPERKLSAEDTFLSVLAIMLVLFAGAGLLAAVAHYLKLNAHSKAINIILNFSVPLKLLAVITAAVTEEIIMRGYVMPRLQVFFKSGFWPIAISTIVFGLGHIGYGTVMNVLGPVLIGLIFAIYYHKYRNLKVLIICHFIIDFISIVLVKGK